MALPHESSNRLQMAFNLLSAEQSHRVETAARAASRLPDGLKSYQRQMMQIGQIELIRMMILEIIPPSGGDDE